MDGNFDGLNGHLFTGWARGRRFGASVKIILGDKELAGMAATGDRPDVTAAGVTGAGFAIESSLVEAGLRRLVDNGDDAPGALSVVTDSGVTLFSSDKLLSPEDMLSLMAMSISIQRLGAPVDEMEA